MELAAARGEWTAVLVHDLPVGKMRAIELPRSEFKAQSSAVFTRNTGTQQIYALTVTVAFSVLLLRFS